MNVLVYSGPGISTASLIATQKILRRILSNSYDVILAPTQMVVDQPWSDCSSLFVMPGGNRRLITQGLGPSGLDSIRQWVFGGGSYLGLGHGAQLAATAPCVNEQDADEWWMGLCPSSCSSIKPELDPTINRTVSEQVTNIVIEQDSWEGHWGSGPNLIALSLHQNSMASFQTDLGLTKSPVPVTILARYSEDPRSEAAVMCPAQNGRVILVGFELDFEKYQLTSRIPKQMELSYENWLRPILSLLALKCDPSPPDHTILSPTPQFLVSRDSQQLDRVATQLNQLVGSDQQFSDIKDVFKLHPNGEGNFDSRFESDEELCHIILMSGTSHRPELAPSFDWGVYFAALSRLGAGSRTDFAPRLGATILYGERVSSTQSLLEA